MLLLSRHFARLLVACGAALAGDGSVGDPLVIDQASSPPISRPDGQGVFDRMVTESARRVGVSVTFQAMSAERALSNVSKGLDDGDGPRIRELDALYPDLVRVDEPLMTYAFVAFSRVVTGPLSGWEDLAGRSVAILRGWKILERELAELSALATVREPSLLFVMLAKDRVDVVVVERHMGRALIAEQGLEGVRELAPPLATRDMYLFLNRRHAALAPRLAQALREMKQDGTHAAILDALEGAP